MERKSGKKSGKNVENVVDQFGLKSSDAPNLWSVFSLNIQTSDLNNAAISKQTMLMTYS